MVRTFVRVRSSEVKGNVSAYILPKQPVTFAVFFSLLCRKSQIVFETIRSDGLGLFLK